MAYASGVVRNGTPIVEGPLDPAVVRRVFRRHLNQFRFERCRPETVGNRRASTIVSEYLREGLSGGLHLLIRELRRAEEYAEPVQIIAYEMVD